MAWSANAMGVSLLSESDMNHKFDRLFDELFPEPLNQDEHIHWLNTRWKHFKIFVARDLDSIQDRRKSDRRR